jgi:hypothetical protein
MYYEVSVLIRNDIIKWVLSYNLIFLAVYSWIIWRGTRQVDLFKFQHNAIMLIFGAWSITFTFIVIFAGKYFTGLNDITQGISKDYQFIILIKFSNDYWIFLNWFYIGFCKNKKAKKGTDAEDQEENDFNALDLHDGRYTTILPAERRESRVGSHRYTMADKELR